MSRKKIAIAFFGITRSLRHTISSIEQNIFEPAKQIADVTTYAHFFDVANVTNARSGEASAADPEEYKLLNADWVQFSQPNSILKDTDFDEIKKFGDHWNDDFASASNLIHQLYSLKTVTTRVLEDNPDIVIFCRPDLKYHDSFQAGLNQAISASDPSLILPYWQRHKGGLNDRFSICVGEKAVTSYGCRIDLALSFCQKMGLELHSERLLRYSATKLCVPTQKLDVRASRVRAEGHMVEEDFSTQSWKMFRNQIRFRRKMAF